MSGAATTELDGCVVHPDLEQERKKCSFKILDFTYALYGPENFAILTKLRTALSRNPAFDLRYLWAIDGSTQQYVRACWLAEEVVKVIRQLKLIDQDAAIGPLQVLAGEDMFVMLHLTMFLPTLKNMCDDEQARYWVPLAEDFRIIGTYCQTELAHGSNVAGLETTADFDEKTDEWVLNTPSLQATKWWPGGLGKSCTHCVCMARLRIHNKDYGVHPFILQVRDLNTHESLPGITLFHLGKKLGYNSMDNGGAQFRNVRIPRRNLLMRYCHVDRQGNYRTLGNKKMMYGTMTFTRKQIIMAAGPHLAKSAVIAIRYSAVRRQFPIKMRDSGNQENGNNAEAQVLDYSTQQLTLFPILAASVAYTMTGIWMDAFYNTFIEEAKKGDFSKLEEIHAVTSCLKATITLAVADGIEKCRKACGGHGYLLASGIPIQFVNFVPVATYEGDRVVLSLQTARVLMKIVQRKMMNKSPNPAMMGSTLEYIWNFDPFEDQHAFTVDDGIWSDPERILEAFKKRACVLVYKAAQQFASETSNGATVMEAMDVLKVEFTRLTVAHAHVLILRLFLEGINRLEPSAIRDVWVDLWFCLALAWCDEYFGDFVITRAFGPDHHDGIMVALKAILRKIRPNAVAIADAFWIPDQLLNSALGRYDGRVYEALLNSTKLEPLNRTDVPPGYLEHIQYILHPDRRKRASPLHCKL
ncbi:acyl-CoA dehydrogenase, middle domain-containing protein [Besnoitia besnoiti]|uniref:Acyl-coenzyme A oxidase n=1 Tax=Besnoitia besnoiti TaxID=94643 RepID=A0A2A9MJY4_BESBE|nr:acyl-CoA dehydrogenase, middle domain-containing protein [Besnoitia besnoiti]PFH38229.1 acyl-CoA dehydrogenase, middle domain-containing protein [Besnoitia besnoiti]